MGRKSRSPNEKKAADSPKSLRLWTLFASVTLVGAIVWYLATPLGSRRAETTRPLNIVLVTADTLRADRLPAYGYDKVRTPNLDRMAAEGILFENAQTVVPLTLPAHSSIFTGTYPMFHGVRDNGGYYLEEEQVTLAESLEEAGYATGGFVAAFVLDSRWGLSQGFDRYFDGFDLSQFERVALDTVQRRGGEVLEEALSWMEGVRDQKFFSWIHFYDAHTPYDPPEPYLGQYADYPWSRYDGEIAYVDSLMGELFDWLDANELADDTIVVFIGDHGESLGQHGELTHGFFIYDATMRVPFLVKTPYARLGGGIRVAAQVRSIDLMPTLLELVGLEPPAAVQGRSLVPLASGTTDDMGLLAYSESFYPRNHYGWSELKSVRDGDAHYISAPRPELFDARSDPQEKVNLAENRSGESRQFEDELRQIEQQFGIEGIDEKTPQTLDPAVQAQLAALGYLGGPSRVKIDPDRPLTDPKDKIHLFNAIKNAGAYSSEGRVEEAKAAILAVLNEDPDILEAHHILGNLYTKEGDAEAALTAYHAALSRDPEYKPALVGLAATYKEMDRPEDAAAGFRRVLELDPRDNRAYFMLAQIRVEAEEFDAALELLRQAVDIGSERAPLHNLMAECYIGLKQLDEAEAEIRRALAMNPELPTAHYNLALVHEERGDVPKAVSAYEKELTISSNNFKTHFNLAKLYGTVDRPQKMAEHFERSIELNEDFAIGYLYLAKYHLDAGNLDEAEKLALRGIELEPEPSMAPLGHFILADVYNRLGRFDDANRELRAAQRLSGS